MNPFSSEFEVLFNNNIRPVLSDYKPEEWGRIVDGSVSAFSTQKGLGDEEKLELQSVAESKLTEFRTNFDIPRLKIPDEEFAPYAERIPQRGMNEPIEEFALKIDSWKDETVKGLTLNRKAETEDVRLYVSDIANGNIRDEAAKSNSTSRGGDLGYRFLEGTVKPIHSIFDPEGAERSWAERAPEDPQYDTSFISQLSGGAGDLISQIGVITAGAAGGAAIGNPAAGAAMASGAYNASRYMTMGYYEEWKRSGDEEKAMDAAISQVPAAALESVSDLFTFGAGKTLRGFGKAFAQATTEEAKRKVLREALPSIKSLWIKNSLSEGTIGGAATEWASGAGMALSTGHEEYWKTSDEIIRSGLIEGILGGPFGAGMGMIGRGKTTSALSQEIGALSTDIDKRSDVQSKIFTALQNRDFDSAIAIANKNVISDPNQIDERLKNFDAERGVYTDKKGEATTTPPVDMTQDEKKLDQLKRKVAARFRNTYFDESNTSSELSKLKSKTDLTDQEKQRLDYLTKTKESLEKGEYDWDGDISITRKNDDPEGMFPDLDSETAPLSRARSGYPQTYKMTFEDGTNLSLSDEGADHAFFIDKKKVPEFNSYIKNLRAAFGEVSFSQSPDNKQLNIVVRGSDGKLKTLVGPNGKPIAYNASFNPKKGFVPVLISQSSDKNTINFKVMDKALKEVNPVPRDFEIVETKENGNVVIKKIKGERKGETLELEGDAAVFAKNMDQFRQNEKQARQKEKEEKLAKPLAKKKELEEKENPDPTELQEVNDEIAAIEAEIGDDADAFLESQELEDETDSEFSKLEQTNNKVKAGKVNPETDTLGQSVNRRASYEGQQGKITQTEDGRFQFESDNGVSFELPGNADSTLKEAGISRNLTNKDRAAQQPQQQEQSQQQQIQQATVLPETNETANQVKAQLKQMLPGLEKKVDKLSNEALFVIGNAINRGFSYESVTREQFNEITNSPNSEKGLAASIVDFDTDTVRNIFVANEMQSLSQPDFEKALMHETFHGAAHRVKANNPELWESASQEVLNDTQLNEFMSKEYSFWNDLTPSLKTFEAIRAINEGRYTGKISGENRSAFKELVQKFLDYINEIFGTSKNKNIQVLTINVEKFLGIDNKADRNALAVYNKIVRGQELSEDDLTENRDIFRDVANMLGVSTSGTKQELIDRVRATNPVKVVDQENETPFAETVSRDDVENISLKGNYGAWIHSNGDLTKVKGQFGHSEVAKELVKGLPHHDSLIDRGFARIVNRPDKVLVQSRDQQLPRPVKRTLEFLGMNDEKNVIQYLANGDEKKIYDHDAVRDIPFAESGDRFVFRLAPEFKKDNVLGLVIAKDGTLPVQNLNAKIRKSGVNEFEIEKLTELVSGLAENGRVNLKELSDVVDTEPTLVINTLDADELGKVFALQHQLDTLGYPPDAPRQERNNLDDYNDYTFVFESFGGILLDELPDNVREIANDYINSYSSGSDINKAKAATGRFGVDPYSAAELKGTKEISPGHKLIWSGDLSLNVPGDKKFESQHYLDGSDIAKNQVAFVRGGIHEYQPGTILPDGTTATETARIMEIWEVQSDWAAKVNKDSKEFSVFEENGEWFFNFAGKNSKLKFKTRKEAVDERDKRIKSAVKDGTIDISGSPLLKYWESLALKAAVNHAQKQGATNIIVSDAETAMMTEGHDSGVNPVSMQDPTNPGTYIVMDSGYTIPNSFFKTKQEADKFRDEYIANYQPSQAKGMRAAYDQRIPNGLAKLTGSKSKRVTVGIHGKAITNRLSTSWDDVSVHKTPSDARTELARLQKENPNSEYSMRESVNEETETQEWVITKANVGNISGSKVFKNSDGTPKNTNTGTMFSVPVNKNVSREIPFAEAQQPTEDTIQIPWMFGNIDGALSKERKEKIKRLDQIRSIKTEAKLAPAEKQAAKGLYAIKAAMLSDESFNEYIKILEGFKVTRARGINDVVTRINVDEVLEKTAKFKLEADTNMFEQMKEVNPEILGNRSFDEFQNNLELVRIAIQTELNALDSMTAPALDEEDESFRERIYAIRDFHEDNKDIREKSAMARIDAIEFPVDQDMVGFEHVKKGLDLMKETIEDFRSFYIDYVDYLLNADIDSLTNKQRRELYYSLMGVTYDSYMMSTDNFVSSEAMTLMNSITGGLNAFPTSTLKFSAKVYGLGVKLRAVASNDQSYQALSAITGKFRESLKRSEMFMQDAAIPYQKQLLQMQESLNGSKFTETDFNLMGIFSELRKVLSKESPREAIESNLRQINKSISNYSFSNDRYMREAASKYSLFVDMVIEDVIGEDKTDIMETLDRNAREILGDAKVDYVNGLSKFFDQFEPIAQFTTEFVYGRDYNSVTNYMPSMVMNLRKDGIENIQDAQELLLSMSNRDTGEKNINRSGMSSTYDKTRGLGEGQALVFNINHLFNNRGRLSFLDYFSSIHRRELTTILKPGTQANKALRKMLEDPTGQLGRVDLVSEAINTTWKNSIQATTYIHPAQRLVNNLAGRWAGGVLSSLYQYVGQVTSNLVPWIQMNIGNTSKVANLWAGYSYYSKYKSGMLNETQTRMMDRLVADMKNRHPDAIMDTSTALAPSKMYDFIKTLPGYELFEKVDKFREKLQFYQFMKSDEHAGIPMLMAEYLDRLQKTTGNNNITFEDMTYDPGVYWASMDEIERFIAIGHASRRGELMTNINPLWTILRNILTGFAGHRLNNAANANIEIRKALNSELPFEARLKSLNYVAAIASQSATFTFMKAGIMMGIMQGIKWALNHDDDEEDEKFLQLLRARDNAVNPEQKKLIEFEISKRREVRKEWNKIKQKEDSDYFMMMSISKDILANISVIDNASGQFISNAIVFSTADEEEKKAFYMLKAQRQKELKLLIKNAKNMQEPEIARKLEMELLDLSSLESVAVAPKRMRDVPFEGMYGGAAQNAVSAFKAFRDDWYLGVSEVSAKDWGMLLGTFGYTLGDLNKIYSILDSQSDAQYKLKEKEEENFAGQRN